LENENYNFVKLQAQIDRLTNEFLKLKHFSSALEQKIEDLENDIKKES
jgi:peptidoglycan hydrolase CwlO-like protein